MGWSKGFMDNDGNCKKRSKFTQSPNRSTNLTERYYTNKVETAKWVDGRIGLHCTLIEGISLVKSEVACVKYDIRKLCSILRCLEPNMETMRKKICEIEQSLSDMKVGEKVLESKEDIDGHNSWTDITKEKEPRKLCPCTPIATDGLLQMKISDKAPHEKVDHMADEKVTELADNKTLMGFNDSKVKNKNDRFPSMRNLSKKDSKILKFLFDKGDNGVDDPREEVARYGDIGVSYGELQCLRPTFPLLRKVIDISAAYLYEEDSKSWFFPTCFGEQAYSNHVSSNSHALVASTIHLCGLQRFHRCLKRCSKIFIPLHDEIEDHWFMLVMKLDRKSAEMWDSLPDIVSSARRFEKARVAMLLLQTIFENEMTKSDDVCMQMNMLDRVFVRDIAEDLNPHVSLGTLPFDMSSFGPIQRNTTDCGVFVIRNMQHYGTDWAAKYDSDGERASLVLECLLHQRNDVPDLHVKVDHALALWRGTVQGKPGHIGSAVIDVSEDSNPSGTKPNQEKMVTPTVRMK
ncbi:uncharacterized protein LOC112168724 isoform X3 [Rosa chinensis]|uniref:uncharacterized protein LOC112168724 isoform X3 n=1 Tax=Rosa chinensis TaxID=74649 RepID=UPI001AD8BCB3|nr:uncharacterized protein LOC112168724 isoform X3 [Rosa chinensis]